ncbi:serine hydrolase domain-containing protein [uncultured Flavobacterium sp.]|uniref:serine hydrolase domain-containing protein n=1 Tax=uncultured Flavobacterium sp. TaxID=165435 RepID=UPI0030EE321B|tara:strand:+ start:83190 stop:84497 length:1308 start_codon:yes stop_codon:yes gene_type:complete
MKKIVLIALLFLTFTGYTQERFQRLDSLLTYLNDNNKFMGSVSLREGNEVVFSKAYGFADEEKKIEATNSTKYKIGSITKTFTATIIMQLIEEKKLRLESKLTKFFPKVQNAEKISIYDLLHHRTGIKDYINQDSLSVEDFASNDLKTVIYNKINNYESIFEPGSQFLYSNSNYYLLGGIIEKLTKESYSSNVDNRIIKKLGLKNTYYPNGKIDSSKKESYSYIFNGTDWEKSAEWGNNVAFAAGEIISTPDDLTEFMFALFNGKLVKNTSLEAMKDLKEGYGIALMQFPFGERKFYGHTGGIENFRAVVGYYPNDNLGVSLIVNGDNFNRNDIMIGILSIYYKIPFPFPNFDKIDNSVLSKYTGIYTSPEIPLKITVSIKNGELIAQATGQPSFPLTPKSDTEFVFQTAGIEMVFEENKFTLKQGGQKFKFTRE